MTSLIINLSFAVFHLQSLSCEVIDKSQGDIDSPNSKYFPLCPPWSISVALLLFEASTSIFCVLIRPLHSLHTLCFRIFAAPVVWSILVIAVLSPPRLVSIVQSFLKVSSSSSRVRILPLRSLSFICFRNFPCLFQSLDYFWKPPSPVISAPSVTQIRHALDRSFSKFHSLPPSTREKALQRLPWRLWAVSPHL